LKGGVSITSTSAESVSRTKVEAKGKKPSLGGTVLKRLEGNLKKMDKQRKGSWAGGNEAGAEQCVERRERGKWGIKR